jgi:hypothetical protein
MHTHQHARIGWIAPFDIGHLVEADRAKAVNVTLAHEDHPGMENCIVPVLSKLLRSPALYVRT